MNSATRILQRVILAVVVLAGSNVVRAQDGGFGAYTTATLRLRASPSPDGHVLTVVPAGVHVHVRTCADHWCVVAFRFSMEFRWQSQNRTTRDSKMGRMIQNHRAEGTAVHLFVRPSAKIGGKTQPFTYFGALEFERWEGDRPITVWWRLPSGNPRN